MKDGHLKETHGFPCIEHTPWRKMKAFWCTAAHTVGHGRLSVQNAHMAGPTLKSSDTKSRFRIAPCASPEVKCSGALNITFKPRKSIWVILLESLCNIRPAFIASIMRIYIASTQTCTDSCVYTRYSTNCLTRAHAHTHTITYKKSIECLSPCQGFFFSLSQR